MPEPLDDCWQAYVWIILNCKSYFGIDFKKVIIAGDSAGGHFVSALAYMSIERNFRQPDGLALFYSAQNTSQDYYSPGLLNSIDDPIVSLTFFNLVARYVHKNKEDMYKYSHHRYISPMLGMQDEILRQFPKVRIMLAGTDGLRD